MYRLFLIFIFICVYAFGYAQVESPLYKKVIDVTLDETVPTVSINHILKFDYSSFVFLDAREKEEFNRSRIKNAHWVGYDTYNDEHLPKMNKSDTIVVYCSIGYRSEKIGEKLKAQGYEQVYNLYGGIFEWVNRDLPVYKNGEQTDSVHAYSPEWGMWLKKGVKVYE